MRSIWANFWLFYLARTANLTLPPGRQRNGMTCHFGAGSGWPVHREGQLQVRIPYLAAGGPDTAHSAECYMLSPRESDENRMSILLPGLGLYLTPQADDVGSRLTIEAEDFLNITYPSIALLCSSFHAVLLFSSNIKQRIKHRGTGDTNPRYQIMASVYGDVALNMNKTTTHTSVLSTKKGMVIDDRGLPTLLRDLSPEEIANLEKKLKRKIDWRLMPPLIVMYIMNYLDRCVPF